MKELIRDILREQTGRDVKDVKITKLKERLRLLFTYMTAVGGSDGCRNLKLFFENHGVPSTYGGSDGPAGRKEMYRLVGQITSGFKVTGLNPSNSGSFMIYTLLVNYEHNGGSQRKFSEGDIELVPGKMVDIDMSMKETVTEYFTLMCEAYGGDKNKSLKVVKENPWLYEVDRQTEDHDYHGDMSMDGDRTETTDRRMNLEPSMFGL